MEIRERSTEDLALVKALLTAAALPLDGLEATRGWVAVADSRVVGHVAAEEFGESVVLRSLVVAPEARGRGIAGALLRYAELQSVEKKAYLRTQTINAWVERLGYAKLPLERVPTELKASPEFSGFICSSVPIYVKNAPLPSSDEAWAQE
jgi:N-acetylglutamate synthase-like GNAT family acetyltransferase